MKRFKIEERTIPDLGVFAEKNPNYVGPHFDQEEGFLGEKIETEKRDNYPLRHINFAFDSFGTIDRSGGKTRRARTKSIICINGAMEHAVSLPRTFRQRYSRTVLVVICDMDKSRFRDVNYEILERNTRAQIRRLG